MAPPRGHVTPLNTRQARAAFTDLLCRLCSDQCVSEVVYWSTKEHRWFAPPKQAPHARPDPAMLLLGFAHPGPPSSDLSSWTDWPVPPGGTANPRLRPRTSFPPACHQGAVGDRVFWRGGGGRERARLVASPSRHWRPGAGRAGSEPRTRSRAAFTSMLFGLNSATQEMAETIHGSVLSQSENSTGARPRPFPVAGIFKMAPRAHRLKKKKQLY